MTGRPVDPDRSEPARSDPDRSDPDQEAPVSTATAPDTQPTVVVEPTGPALGTLVWGCTALAVAVLLGLRELLDLRVDPGLVVPVGMVALGLLLLVGALVTVLRERR